MFLFNGTIRKCNKAKTKDIMKFVEISPKDYIVIVDAGHMWRLGTPKTEEYVKNDGTKMTWRDFATRTFDTLVSRHPNAKSFVIVNDYYGSDVINPKDCERKSRGKKFVGGNSPNVYPVSTKELPSVRLLCDFFKNSANKERFQIFLRDEFARMCKARHVSMIYSIRSVTLDISTSPSKHLPLYNNQKIEADNAMFYIYNQLRKSGDNSPVVCDAADADVLVTAAYVSTKVPGVLGIKQKKGIFQCDQLLPAKVAKISVRGHVISGMDNISSFFGVGKISIWNRILKSPEAQQLLETMTEDSIRKFIIKFVYNDKTSETLTEMRKKRWEKMKKKDFKRIGIDEDTNKERTKRVIFNISAIEHFDIPTEYGNPLSSGYKVNDEGRCVPIRYNSVALSEDILGALRSVSEPNEAAGREEGSDDEDGGDEENSDDEQEEIEV